MINTTSERLKKQETSAFVRSFSFYEQLQLRTQLSWAWNKFYNLEARAIGSSNIGAKFQGSIKS